MEYYFSSLFTLLINVWYIPIIAVGVASGIVLGALPGISAPMALAIMVPLTYSLEPDIGFGLLIGLFNGVVFGGSIPAVLVNIPGTPGAVVTTLDGYPMTVRGEAGKALGIVAIASFIGGIFSTICLIVISPLLSAIAMKFSPHDYFAVGILGLCITTGISGKSVFLGFWAAMFGILISTIGMDYITSQHRFVFGVPQLLGGISLLSVMIGLFGFSHVLFNISMEYKKKTVVIQKIKNFFPSLMELLAPLRDRLQYLVEKRFRGESARCENCNICK